METKVKQIENLIKDGGSAKFAKLIAEVQQKVKKTNNPLRNSVITKLVTYQMSLNCNYQNKVNAKLEKEHKEPNFQAKENWFVKVNDSYNGSIVAKKSNQAELYLLFICEHANINKYLVDGQEATPEQITIINQFKEEPQTPTNQGLNNPIIVRTIKIENIKQIKCGETLTFSE